MADEPKWWAGRNEEWFTDGPFETRDAAMLAGKELARGYDEEGFWIAHASKQSVRFDAHRLIEEQYFENEDLFSFEDGNEPDRLDGADDADKELQTFLDAWVAKHEKTFVQPTLFASCKSEYIRAKQVPA